MGLDSDRAERPGGVVHGGGGGGFFSTKLMMYFVIFPFNFSLLKPNTSTMFLVGLSGGIASGKSTVVAVLRELGCAVIDADVIAREVVQPHFKAYQQIVRYFGTEILLENGEINREALGNIIFSHPEKRQLLNSITHPEIQKEMLKQILKYFVLGYRYVILDIPLLFETNRLPKFMKYTVLVYWFLPTSCACGKALLPFRGCSRWRG
ncbi:dephospho-CoA kinase domain-containing protein isoform X5 [Calonectris borealis]|uniref:dephospho-CoA kinase domain-containing protein isoform X5 n=1 Tax=Calonectris borealis TaxID=1323832 RepID=UPI003F4BE2E4